MTRYNGKFARSWTCLTPDAALRVAGPIWQEILFG